MGLFGKRLTQGRGAPTVILAIVVLLAAWMGYASGGYFVGDWAPPTFLLAALVVVVSVAGVLYGLGSRWSIVAVGLFAGYAVWSCLSLLWSPNQGDAWLGAGQTLLYLLAFGIAVALTGSGASHRWVLFASVLGPAGVAVFTLLTLVADSETLFDNNRLVGTVGYYNGEAAFLLVPFWGAVYLAGSRRINPILRGVVLAGATVGVEVAFLTQSRGALVAMAVSLPVFFVVSGQRLRGLLALIPLAAALLVSLSDLNEVYLTFLNDEDPSGALEEVTSVIWWTCAASGLYGLVWGTIDHWWRPPANLVRVVGAAVLVVLIAACVGGAVVLGNQVGNPVTWTTQKWEAFKNNDTTGEEQSRYLSASGSGRYTLWQVAWKDFASHPLIGIGTQNYEATYYQLRERSSSGYVRQPHILQLEVLSERGVVGGALFFGFLGVCLAVGIRRRFSNLSAEDKALVGATIAAIAYWFIHSTAEWFWQLPAVTLPVIVYLAVLVAPWRRVDDETTGWPLRAGMALVAVLMAAFVVPIYIADRYLAQSYATENPWVALEAVESAQRFNPLDPQLPQREAELAIQIGNWPRVERAYGEAIELNPEHYAPHALLGSFYEQLGESKAALSSYSQALALNPLDEELKRQVAKLEAGA